MQLPKTQPCEKLELLFFLTRYSRLLGIRCTIGYFFSFGKWKRYFIKFFFQAYNLDFWICMCRAASWKNQQEKITTRKNNSMRKHILYLKICFLDELFFLVDFYMKRPIEVSFSESTDLGNLNWWIWQSGSWYQDEFYSRWKKN